MVSKKKAAENEEYSNQQKNQKKSKQVKKQDDKPKQQKRSSGAKKGRPPKSQKVDVLDNPASQIQEKMLNYLDAIGLKHGLVFREPDRKKLNEEGKSIIKWKQTHQWDHQKQLKKIKEHPQISKTIKKYVGWQQNVREQASEQFWTYLTFEQISQIFLNVSDLAAEQCTLDIYIVLAQLLEAIMNNQNQKTIENKIKQLQRNRKIDFLSANFTTTRIKYWIQIQKDRSKIVNALVKMCIQIRQKMWKMLLKPKQIQDYLKQQAQAYLALKRIADELTDSNDMGEKKNMQDQNNKKTGNGEMRGEQQEQRQPEKDQHYNMIYDQDYEELSDYLI